MADNQENSSGKGKGQEVNQRTVGSTFMSLFVKAEKVLREIQ